MELKLFAEAGGFTIRGEPGRKTIEVEAHSIVTYLTPEQIDLFVRELAQARIWIDPPKKGTR